MPSYHAQGNLLPMARNFLYCNDNPASSCHTGGAAQTDVVNIHMKPGNNEPTEMESVMSTWTAEIAGILQSNELASQRNAQAAAAGHEAGVQSPETGNRQ